MRPAMNLTIDAANNLAGRGGQNIAVSHHTRRLDYAATRF